MPKKEVFSVKETAKYIGCHESTVLRLIRSGRLQAASIGTERKPIWRVPRKSLETFLDKPYEREE